MPALAGHEDGVGANWWISGISGPFGPFGSEAVVMTRILSSVASFASIVVLAGSSARLDVDHGLEQPRLVVQQQDAIEAHEGRLWASANDRGGAIFQFTLPAPLR